MGRSVAGHTYTRTRTSTRYHAWPGRIGQIHCFISAARAITKRNQSASRKRVKGRRAVDNECRHIANDKIFITSLNHLEQTNLI